MSYHVFELLYTDPAQVNGFLLSMVKEGLVGGVYLWINRTNGKMYVASSINLYSRISGYLNFSNLHGIIGKAFLKYGLDAFVLVIFFVPNATSSLVLALEQSILDGCTCAYNILPTAGSLAGYKHSDEAREKMSAAKKGRDNNCKGRKASKETKAKISASLYNRGQTVYLYVIRGHGLELVALFPNKARASEYLKVSHTTVRRYIQNERFLILTGYSI